MQPVKPVNHLLLFTLITACSQASTQQTVQQKLPTILSWAATAHRVGEAWREDSVPTVYAKQTLQKTLEELDRETKTLRQQTPQNSAQVLRQLEQLHQTIQQLRVAVERKQSSQVDSQLQQLATQQRQLQVLVRSSK